MTTGRLIKWARFTAIAALVVPFVLLITACGGAVTGEPEEIDPELIISELEQFKECVDLAQSDQQPAEYLITIIMDNSGSMCDIHDEFSSKLDGLFAGLPTQGAAIRMGVITTDMSNAGHKGELHTSKVDLTKQWVDFDLNDIDEGADDIRAIMNNIGKTHSSSSTCGGSGTGTERGLDAAYKGIYELTEAGGVNDGYLDGQDDAHAVVVYISDEEDDSQTSNMVTDYPNGHLAAFDDMVNAGKFASHTQIAVAHNEALPNICGVPADGDEYYWGYEDFVSEDFFICDDWNDTFDSLASSVFNPSLCANLGIGLIASTIEATLADGTVVTEYTYDPDSGEICFEPGALGTNTGDVTTFCGLPITGEE
jgi:hypothetical protein